MIETERHNHVIIDTHLIKGVINSYSKSKYYELISNYFFQWLLILLIICQYGLMMNQLRHELSTLTKIFFVEYLRKVSID
jgi:hypothetical protein